MRVILKEDGNKYRLYTMVDIANRVDRTAVAIRNRIITGSLPAPTITVGTGTRPYYSEVEFLRIVAALLEERIAVTN